MVILVPGSSSELRTIALNEFATTGYGATSLHRIAEIAGLSKASVLYHFDSKDALLEAAVTPAIDKMNAILDELAAKPVTKKRRDAFIVQFVDFLLEHRLEIYLFINQGPSLSEVPVIQRGIGIVQRFSSFFGNAGLNTEERMRFGVALGGAAYLLVTEPTIGIDSDGNDNTREGLIKIVRELLAPVPVSVKED
ncbi:MAG: TetR/AcrR family transcriptional regulator [Microbacteriaceae bacterium]|nr:TetR/AcrR family transcriptional regulator [Microbacteriaceae bacterium]